MFDNPEDGKMTLNNFDFDCLLYISFSSINEPVNSEIIIIDGYYIASEHVVRFT